MIKEFESISEYDSNGKTIYFDVGDTLDYFSLHQTASGIQRVVLEIWRQFSCIADLNLIPICTDLKDGSFKKVDPKLFNDLLKSLDAGQKVTEKALKILLFASKTEKLKFKFGSYIFAIGAPWSYSNYAIRIKNLKKAKSIKLITMIYDLVPIVDPEFPTSTKMQFVRNLVQTLFLSNVILTISESTKRDLISFASKRKLPLAEIFVTGLTSGINSRPNSESSNDGTSNSRFVLSVGTIENRKNHLLLLKIWKQLLDELPVNLVPELILVGKLGWHVEELIDFYQEHEQLHSKVFLLKNYISDATLEQLYADCSFTIYPSRYEGWGLPVSESLARGKVVIAANKSSIPEAGQNSAIYADIENFQECYDIVKNLIVYPEVILKQESHIKNNFEHKSWQEITERLIDQIMNHNDAKLIEFPELEIGIEYGLGPITEIVTGANSQKYQSDLFQLRSLPLTGQINDIHREALASMALTGEVNTEFTDSRCVAYTSKESWVTLELQFIRTSMENQTLLLSTFPLGGLLNVTFRRGSLIRHTKVQAGGATYFDIGSGNVGELVSIEIVIEPTSLVDSKPVVRITSFMISPGSGSDIENQIKINSSFLKSMNGINIEELLTYRASIQSSLSWRITKPLRLLTRLARKILGK